ncbi:MAG: nucleotidyltransferase domain-containing protein [Nanobdellota archaeon]
MAGYTNEQIEEALNQFLEKVKSHYTIDKALLFGSRARNDHLLASDVDIILVSDDFQHTPFRKRATEIIGYWDEDIDLEVLCYTNEEFNRKSKQIGIVNQAVKEGKPIA